VNKKFTSALVFTLSFHTVFAQQKKQSLNPGDTLTSKNHLLRQVVISASKTSENILRSPVSIERVDTSSFKLSAAPSFFDALENVKGVQMITPSLGFRIINTRGFANTTNVRFTQLVDGVDNQAPHIGAPIGNAMGPSDLDIEHVEIIPGTASALYGLNAINGLANFITKNPFTSTGITIQQKTGVNHVNDPETSAKLYSETSFRVAEKISNRFAFKLNGTFTKGYDWIANDRTDLNATANTGVGIPGGVNNPGYDPTSGYGNESSDRKTVTLGGKQYVVARTGYYEKEVTTYNLQNVKADLGLVYKLTDKTSLTYTYRFADINNIYQRSNRFQLKDYILQQHALELKNPVYQFRAYLTTENTGKSYNLRSAAENEDIAFKSNTNWYNDFTTGFNQAIAKTATTAQQALIAARQFADQGRLQPGTTAFNNTLSQLADVNNWDIGSALRVNDQMLHVEGQVDISKAISPNFKKSTGFDFLAGFDHRDYIIDPDGNYFVNPDKSKPNAVFTYGKTGGFIQAGKDLLDNTLRLTATLRADRNDYFNLKFNPRFTAVYSPVEEQNFRISYQSGYRFPSIFEAFSNVNSGGVKRIGGLRVMSNGVLENSYLKSSIDAFQAAVKNDFNTQGISTAAAIQKEKGLLVKNYYNYIQPEHINSFEMGYKALFLDQQLKVDLDFYYNKYDNFIAQVEMSTPNTNNPDSTAIRLNDKNLQSHYRVWTNSKTTVYNYGGSLGLSYYLLHQFTISGNASYAQLDRISNNDGLEDGFNTPKWITNFAFGGDHIYRSLGFNISYKWQSGYYSQTFLVNGNMKAYGNVDAQVNYNIIKTLNLKVGASNLFNHYYYSYLGGPMIGGLYYTTLTYQL
jgi:outer membrane receptor protein involved in Fe transport